MPASDRRRPMPWVRTREALEDWERQAALLVGQELVAVRYFTIDAVRSSEDWPEGIREVVAAEEWAEPGWQAVDFDAIDFGIELETARGEVFGVIWEVSGDNEGLSLRRERLLEARLRPDGAFAVWDVRGTRMWAPCVGRPVTAAELIWRRGRDLCCQAIVLRFGDEARHLTLADSDLEGRYVLSCDNVAVLDDAAARRYADGGHGEPSETLEA